MKKHTRQTRLALGQRTPPAWVAVRKSFAPDWNCPTPESEKAFKLFIFSELDQRSAAEVDAMAALVQSAEARNRLAELVASGWTPEPPPERGPGRPKVDVIERQFVPSEDGARTVTMIREIFEDYWDKWNRGRPSAKELAAEYVGVRAAQVEIRLKRAKARRPSN